MTAFFQFIFLLIKHSKDNFLIELREFFPLNRLKLFLFFFLIFISQYAGFRYFTNNLIMGQLLFAAIFIAIHSSAFLLWIFLDTTITNFFLNHHTSILNSKHVFYLMSLSCYPYLFFVPLSILWAIVIGEQGYFAISTFCFIWTIKIRFNWLYQYQSDFRIRPVGLVLLPLCIEFGFILLVLSMFSLSLWMWILYFMEQLKFLIFNTIAF